MAIILEMKQKNISYLNYSVKCQQGRYPSRIEFSSYKSLGSPKGYKTMPNWIYVTVNLWSLANM